MDTPTLVQSFSNLGVHCGHMRTPESADCWALPSRKSRVQEFVFPVNSHVALLLDQTLGDTALVHAAAVDAERLDTPDAERLDESLNV